MSCKELVIDGVKFFREDQVRKEKIDEDYKIVRTYSAGVFYGIIEKREGQEVTLRNARRLWQWAGAASLSQLAIDGTQNPKVCKFPEAVNKILLLQVIEILDMTEKAKKSLDSVPVWKM